MSYNSTNTTIEQCNLFEGTSYVVQIILGLISFGVLICNTN